MKKELTNEQIARIFAMYLGCELKYEDNSHTTTLESVSTSGLLGDENRDESGEGWYDASDCKLLLTPLSAISDEDAIEAAKIIRGEGNWHICVGIEIIGRMYKTSMDRATGRYIQLHQFLIQRGYAVPLFIEPNHPLNGKTAIKLGLAIDKTKEVSHG